MTLHPEDFPSRIEAEADPLFQRLAYDPITLPRHPNLPADVEALFDAIEARANPDDLEVF